MTVKERVLVLLEENKNTSLSGEKLAEQLGCTRAAVGKAITALRAEGYDIQGVNNKGYMLTKSPDVLSAAYVKGALETAGIDIIVNCEHSVDSTNNVLKSLAASGEKRDMVLIAEEQTAGRGRQGRSFYSPSGTGIYMSFLLHPQVAPVEASMLTTLAATAEAQALEAVSDEEVLIKWVNDVYINGKKVSGILTESSISMEDLSLDYVIVGIGINLYEPEGGFPAEIKDVAGAVFAEGTVDNLKNRVAVEMISRFMDYYKEFPTRSFLGDYEKKCFVIGKEITILTADHAARPGQPDRSHAKVLGINDECNLLVEYADGSREYLSSGEISVRVK